MSGDIDDMLLVSTLAGMKRGSTLHIEGRVHRVVHIERISNGRARSDEDVRLPDKFSAAFDTGLVIRWDDWSTAGFVYMGPWPIEDPEPSCTKCNDTFEVPCIDCGGGPGRAACETCGQPCVACQGSGTLPCECQDGEGSEEARHILFGDRVVVRNTDGSLERQGQVGVVMDYIAGGYPAMDQVLVYWAPTRWGAECAYWRGCREYIELTKSEAP